MSRGRGEACFTRGPDARGWTCGTGTAEDAREYLPLLTKLEEHIAEVGRGYGRKFEVHKVIPPMIPPVREALSSGKGHASLRTVKTELLDYSAVRGLDAVEKP